MSKQKLTPWFKGNVKPVHVGLYQVKRNNGVGNIYPSETELLWTGVSWVHTYHSSNGLFINSNAHVGPRCKWRGLTEAPSISPIPTNQPEE